MNLVFSQLIEVLFTFSQFDACTNEVMFADWIAVDWSDEIRFMNTRNNRGPRSDPWGTPWVTLTLEALQAKVVSWKLRFEIICSNCHA